MDQETKKQIEQFVRVGAAALIEGKPLEDVLNIATTGISVIEKLRAEEAPQKKMAKTTRNK